LDDGEVELLDVAVVIGCDRLEERRRSELFEKQLGSGDDLRMEIFPGFLPANSDQVHLDLDKVDCHSITLVNFEKQGINKANYGEAIFDMEDALEAKAILHKLFAAFYYIDCLALLLTLI